MIVEVNLGSRSYRIVVVSGALESVGQRLRELAWARRAALVSDLGRCSPRQDGGRGPVYGGLHRDDDRGTRGRGRQDPGGRPALLGPAARRRGSTGPPRCWPWAAAPWGRGRLRRGHLHARHQLRAAPDDGAGPGRRLDRRQDRDRPPAGQEHDRGVPPAPARHRRSRRRPHAARARVPLRPAEIVKHGIVLDADYFAELERDLALWRRAISPCSSGSSPASADSRPPSSSATSVRPSCVTS